MDVKVTFKEKKTLRLDYLEFGDNDQNRIVLGWSSSAADEPGVFYGNNVLIENDILIDEQAQNTRFSDIIGKPLTALQVYDEEQDKEMDWTSIESITFSDGTVTYCVPEILFSQYRDKCMMA